MKKTAVLFDLFYTLISPWHHTPKGEDEYTVLGMELSQFESLNAVNYEERACGRIREPAAMIAHILKDYDYPEETIQKAAEARMARIRRAIYHVDKKNLDLLRTLRETGYKTALISNADIADIYYWKGSALSECFDETLFSYDTGLLKPDPRIYELALERLGAAPGEALFAGDGGHRELVGAKKAGITTVLTTEYIQHTWPERIPALKKDADYTVERIEEILDILKSPDTE
ncbi:HAD family hydrolase [Breznakiella homolactica]|uniref:HAD-IA family hydrolase n=1 Tax=Breznakiella homolactica TaxID=2798577 RepID=A0A7T8BCR7_9SPIR|nr:HAD-IA family hydrolase [Breznakiella homolactica]QQO10548.1 HAD-IA family hydrolase [Breznakiella homolactica]